ncbi:uncharacterized protein LOC111325284 isoform X2 [Stylophora pistillata]|uniref:uncharacterized protein LOC111325284 isoform X2 n=1 Tax=Stylophora pistillata TaxID=50429 RepID=UPI000C051132|nr:uncharacterized protein LOC111325284 isoform X2 [Stylophora pistillata]
MNFPSRSTTGKTNEPNQRFKSRLTFDDKLYKSASEALEAYITQFEGGRSYTTYRRRPSDLLSPTPKFYFMDAQERYLRSPPGKSPAKKVDELLAWVNNAYAKDLSSKVTPFGYRTTTGRPRSSDEETMNSQPGHGHRSYFGNDDEISSLPSPSSSLVDLDSNAGTVETEVLLSSYKGNQNAAPGLYSSKVFLTRSPITASWKTHSRCGRTEYPSWVSGLGKEYPSWVEDLDTTTRESKVKYSPDEKYSSSTSSPSETKPFTRSSRSKSALKLSDLQSGRSKDPSRVGVSKVNGTDWNDGASTDTDMLLSQSVYGPNPVNMGGNFHSSLYQDKKVARLKKESTKKLRKSTGKIKSREHSTVSPKRSKSLTLTPTKSLRFSTGNGYSEGKEDTPLRTAGLRDSSPGRSPFTTLPSRYSIPPQNERYTGSSAEAALRSVSPKMTRMYISPPVVTRYSNLPVKKEEVTSPLTVRREPSTSPNSAKSPSRVRIPLETDFSPRNEESDVESEDTDREMRKSPTGIKMEKMYRDPNTMYPWKTMIQSSQSRDVAAAKFPGPKPQYYSTPKISTSRDPQKPFSSSLKHPYSSRTSNGGLRGDQRVVFSERSSQPYGREARAQQEHKSPIKPVFAGSSYRSRDEKLAKSAPDARYRKPPIPARSTGGNSSHRRSKTVPDLRRVAMRSASRPKNSRRSLDDDVVSVNTADTERLITHPPMPLFDVSPSLTTVSDSDTLVESETETDTHMGVIERSQMSPPHVADASDKFSPTSVFASTNPHAAVREELPQRFHLWKLDEDTKAPDSFITRRFTNPKSGIISSFLDDCLSVDSEDKTMKEPSVTSTGGGGAMRLSGKEAAPGPVEALKQMLFTMQDMAHHETLDSEDPSCYKGSSSMDFKSKVIRDSLSSEIICREHFGLNLHVQSVCGATRFLVKLSELGPK